MAPVSALAEIETPALLLDADRLEANLTRMADLCREHGRALRPHAKSHKTAEIAARQRALGAVGVTVAKLDEAQILVEAGCEDVFVCYPLVGAGKLRRLLALAERARVSTIVDDRDAAAALGRAARAAGTEIEVLVKLDLGMHRVGVPEPEAEPFAMAVAGIDGLRLRGLDSGNRAPRLAQLECQAPAPDERPAAGCRRPPSRTGRYPRSLPDMRRWLCAPEPKARPASIPNDRAE